MKKFLFNAFFLSLSIGLFVGVYWFHWFRPTLQPGQEVTFIAEPPAAPEVPIVRDAPDTEVRTSDRNPTIDIEAVASGLDTPWDIVFTSPTRMLVTERPGQIRVVENGVLEKQPIHVFSEVVEKGEDGLMSLALDPNYPQNHFLYAAIAYADGQRLWLKVMRFVDAGDTLADSFMVIDRIPAAQYHSGCRIAFGPDGKLYITTGDATDGNLAQDLESLAGKILRINSDGTIPADNPFVGSAIWSYGHRNPQGLAWQLDTGILYETEHGPTVFDGPAGGDEVNVIERGGNYGWPLVSHEKSRAGMISPLLVFTPAEAPGSLMIYSGRVFPEWRGDLFFGALKGEGLMRIRLDESNPKQIASYGKLREVSFGRIRAVVEGPDGNIYFTTSNRDGRGQPSPLDDRIFRLRAGD
ncbi:MAG: PQQ-dependent sugar dehydrogenase [Candidatus Moraniibacteriota bacterium]|nr:MAG: PQQ-dependent sugar dehydrogenase [Candidatus Moranbacteria bacterium]